MDENPGQPVFEVGKRAYWIHESPDMYVPVVYRRVRDGVVMSTGPAVTQLWDDSGNDPRDHYAVTFANDKIWAESETPRRIAHEKNAKDLARYEAARQKMNQGTLGV